MILIAIIAMCVWLCTQSVATAVSWAIWLCIAHLVLSLIAACF